MAYQGFITKARDAILPYHRERDAVFHVGDALGILKALPPESVHCCITSPPYWGLRDYKLPPTLWGGDKRCRHRWGLISRQADRYAGKRKWQHLGVDALAAGLTVRDLAPNAWGHPKTKDTASCRRCGAWSGQLGLEPTPDLYVQHVVEVFREVKRVLRRDGTLWLNLGDTYATGGGLVGQWPGGGPQGERWRGYRGQHGDSQKNRHDGIGPVVQPNRLPLPGLKPKDLVGIPWRVAFALQADGWYLRSDVIWAKPNPMPESVRDRPTRAHEYLFLFSRSERYFYDADAIKEPSASGPSDVRKMMEALPRIGGKHKDLDDPLSKASAATNIGRRRAVGTPAGRNRRTVWTIATEPFPGAHFATFATRLVEPCILAGTSERGCCPRCGAPWTRLVGRPQQAPGRASGNKQRAIARQGQDGRRNTHLGYAVPWRPTTSPTLGWRPSCRCDAGQPVPCVVLDAFGGAGTTSLVARRLGRHSIYIDLSQDYADMAIQRVSQQVLESRAL